MNKMNLAGTSLIAAIPAGILSYLMLMSVLNSMDVMPTMMKVTAILLLLTALVVLLLPAYIFIYYGGKGKQKAAAPSKTPAETGAVPSAVEKEELSGSFDDDLESGLDEDEEDAEDDDFDAGDDFDLDDEFEFDEDEEEKI